MNIEKIVLENGSIHSNLRFVSNVRIKGKLGKLYVNMYRQRFAVIENELVRVDYYSNIIGISRIITDVIYK